MRSALRRAASSMDVIGFEPVAAFAAALKRIPTFHLLDDAVAEAGMALMAQPNVLGHGQIKAASAPVPGLLPKLLGEKVGDQRKRLSELRFQRLLRSTDSDDRLQQLRRAIALLETRIHPMAVLDAWLDLHCERGRRDFARAYFTGLSMSSDFTTPNETLAAEAV
jgi:CRISPR type I-E-associated protein CasB/Cse2